MRMAIEPDKYVPELHRVLLSTLDELVNQIEFDESLSFSVMMPIIMATRMLEPGNTLEQGGLCLCQIAHCCRVMGLWIMRFIARPRFCSLPASDK